MPISASPELEAICSDPDVGVRTTGVLDFEGVLLIFPEGRVSAEGSSGSIVSSSGFELMAGARGGNGRGSRDSRY